MADSFLSPEEHNVVVWLNFARGNPHGLADELEKRLAHYDGMYYTLPGQKTVTTVEGAGAVRAAIERLRALQPMGPLAAVPSMCLPARDHVKTQGPIGKTGHEGPDGSDPFTRMQRYAGYTVAAENIDYGHYMGSEIVIALVIDDGIFHRGHFNNIFNPEFNQVGIATGPHDYYVNMCVHTYATGWTPLPAHSGDIGPSVFGLVALEGPAHTTGAGDYLASKVQAVIRGMIAKRFVNKLKQQRALRQEADALVAARSEVKQNQQATLAAKHALHKSVAAGGQLMAALFKSGGLVVQLYGVHGLPPHAELGGADMMSRAEVTAVTGTSGVLRATHIDKATSGVSQGCDPQYTDSVFVEDDDAIDNKLNIRIRIWSEDGTVVLGVADIPMSSVADRPDLALDDGADALRDAAVWFALESEDDVVARDVPAGLTLEQLKARHQKLLAEGTKTNYEDCGDEGNTVYKWVHQDGGSIAMLYQNNTTTHMLEEETTYTFTNMCIDGEPESLTELKLLIGPGEERLVVIETIDDELAFGLGIENSYDVLPFDQAQFDKKTAGNGLSKPNRKITDPL